MVNYFFDSYAIIELLKRNPNYKKFEDFPLITTVFNKMEVAWWASGVVDENFAKIVSNSLFGQEISDDLIVESVIMRRKEKRKDLSYADCLGYCFARKNNLIFLTGDKEFKDLPGVEFVK
jgi:predicted nucleic acid-binding protein